MGQLSRTTSPEEFPLLKSYGLKATAIVGDGNCLFNALSDQIFGDQSHSSEIRAAVVKNMRENVDDFKHFVPVVGGGRRNPKRKNAACGVTLDDTTVTEQAIDLNFERYLMNMAKNRTYGDNLEIRAFSKAYDTDVCIYKPESNILSQVAIDGVARRTAHIALHSWEHYSSVRNLEGPFTGLPNVQFGNVDTLSETLSAPSTPSTSSQSGSSSISREQDSSDGEEEPSRGPKRRKSKESIADLDKDVPAISLITAIEIPRPRIILRIGSKTTRRAGVRSEGDRPLTTSNNMVNLPNASRFDKALSFRTFSI